MPRRRENIVGRKFNMLTVVSSLGPIKKTNGKSTKSRSAYKCICDCGKEKILLSSNLKENGKGTKSCGCIVKNKKKYNFTDLTGKKFNELTVIKRLPEFTKTRGALWECVCTCGNIKSIASNSLTSGNTSTCGDRSKHAKENKVGELHLAYINTIKQNAIKRNFIYDVSNQYLWELFLKQNRKCAITNIPLIFNPDYDGHKFRYKTTASLDRIDSKLGYIVGNVQWVHKDINIMKSDYGMDEFVEYCRKVFICDLNRRSLQNRPSFDEYFIKLAFSVSLRSEDKFIKHGSVIIDNHTKHVIGTGYNSLHKGCDHNLVDLNDRNKRREWMIHSEENAIMNCTKNPLELENKATIYITALPCTKCLQRLINFGITRIVTVNRIGTITENKETEEMRSKIILDSNIILDFIPIENIWISSEFLDL